VMKQLLLKVTTIILTSCLGILIPQCPLFPDGLTGALTNPSFPLKPGRNCRENKLLIIGLGRIGLEVADLAVEKEIAEVFGTIRDSSLKEAKGLDGETALENNSKMNLTQVPFDPVLVRKQLFGTKDKSKPNENCVVPASHVLFTIPLAREIDPLMQAVLNEIREWWTSIDDQKNDVSNNESKVRCQSKVLGILSTTGVYGNHFGKVVTEHSQLLCEKSSNADLYRKFEDDWIFLSKDDVVTKEIMTADKTSDTHRARRLRIFRCAGIYDSSRSALHTVYKNLELSQSSKKTRNSTTPGRTTMNKTNRIHASDLARGVLSAMFQEVNGEDKDITNSEVRVYNLADDLPEARSVVISHAQDLLASIGFEQRAVRDEQFTTKFAKTTDNAVTFDKRSSNMRQKRRERESKLVCNKRMKKELFPDDGLLFPTYREGLDAIFNDPTTPWRQ